MNARFVISSHYRANLFRRCPVCQLLIDQDHQAAIWEDEDRALQFARSEVPSR